MDEARHALDPTQLLSQAGRLQAIARRFVGDAHTAEDLVQDTWVAALEADVARMAKPRDAAGWRAWVGGVTRNLSARRARRDDQRRAVERAVARAEHPGTVSGLEDRLQLQQQLSEAIVQLEEPYRSALVLRYLDGLEHGEIARRQGISQANARKRVSRALAMLRARMGVPDGGSRGAWAALCGLFDPIKKALSSAALGGQWATSSMGMGGLLVGAKTWIGVTAIAAGIAVVATFTGEEPLEGELDPLTGVAEEELAPARGEDALEQHVAPRPPAEGAREGPADTSRVPLDSAERWVGGQVASTSGHGLAGVHVRWIEPEPERELEAVTQKGGSFRLPWEGEARALRFEHRRFLPAVVEPSGEGPLQVTLLARPRVRGVVRGRDGEPVAPPGRVWLFIAPEGAQDLLHLDAEVQEDGSYLFDDLPQGQVRGLRARAKGHDQLEEQRDLTLVAEETLELDLELPRGLVVVGTVRDAETKQPVPYAKVWSRDFQYDENSLHASTTADGEGRFRLEGVQREGRDASGHAYQILWISGGSPDHASSPWNPKLARENEEGVCEVDLELVPLSCALHVVLFEPGRARPAPGVRVWVVDAERNFTHHTTDGEGELALESLPAGNIGLVAFRDQRNGAGDHESLVFEQDLLPGNHERVELELRTDPGTAVEGQVRDPAGAPVAGAEVLAKFDLHFNGLSIPLAEELQRTDEVGRYRFEGLRAGRHRIVVKGCALPHDLKLDLEPGLRHPGVDFVRGTCMVVRGRVELGEHSPDKTLLRLLHPVTAESLDTTRPEEDGSFRFDEIVEGPYEVVLYQDNELEVDRSGVRPGQATGIVLHMP